MFHPLTQIFVSVYSAVVTQFWEGVEIAENDGRVSFFFEVVGLW